MRRLRWWSRFGGWGRLCWRSRLWRWGLDTLRVRAVDAGASPSGHTIFITLVVRALGKEEISASANNH